MTAKVAIRKLYKIFGPRDAEMVPLEAKKLTRALVEPPESSPAATRLREPSELPVKA